MGDGEEVNLMGGGDCDMGRHCVKAATLQPSIILKWQDAALRL